MEETRTATGRIFSRKCSVVYVREVENENEPESVPSVAARFWHQMEHSRVALLTQLVVTAPQVLLMVVAKYFLELKIIGTSSSDDYSELSAGNITCARWVEKYHGIETLVPTIAASFYVVALTYSSLRPIYAAAWGRFLHALAFLAMAWALYFLVFALQDSREFDASALPFGLGILFLADFFRLLKKKRGKLNNVRKVFGLFLKVSGIPMCIVLFSLTVMIYLNVSMSSNEVWIDVALSGVLFPMAQFVLRKLFMRTNYKFFEMNKTTHHETLPGGEDEDVHENFIRELYMMVEIFLSTPAFVALFLINDNISFLLAVTLAFAFEIVGLYSTLLFFAGTVLGDRARVYVDTLEFSSGSGQENCKVDKKKLLHGLARRISSEEFGEKNAILVALFTASAIAWSSSSANAFTDLFQSLELVLQRFVVTFFLENIVDGVKQVVCARFQVFSANTRIKMNAFLAMCLSTAVMAVACMIMTSTTYPCYV